MSQVGIGRKQPQAKLIALVRPGATGGDVPEPDLAARLAVVFAEHRTQLQRFLNTRLGSSAESEDVAQLAVVRLLERSDTLTGQDLKALLFVTARNLSTDRLRERSRRAAVAAPAGTDAAEVADDAPSAERSLAAREEMALLRRLIAELPPKCRTAFLRFAYDEADYATIAAELAVSTSMVRKYVARALAYCAAQLDRREGWE